MKLDVVHAGMFKLDGGAMFGVVPKSLWTRLNKPDENNLCTWAMRCLLVQTDNRKILIDTGIGNKQDEKFRSHFHPHGDQELMNSLSQVAISAEEITDVILTHFHFDHVGGAVLLDENGTLKPSFPNARYWSNQKHYRWALDPNPREKASFLKENFVPLVDQGVLNFIDPQDDVEFCSGIKFKFVYGHTEAMMLPQITLDSGKELLYCADLLPSVGHIGMPYVMSYDIRPLSTLEEKQRIFDEVLTKDMYLFLEHDKDNEICTLKKNDRGRVVLDKCFDLQEITMAS